jgi:hypothetical protein
MSLESNGRTPQWLLEAAPTLHELVRQVIPARKMPGNVYVDRSGKLTLFPRN